MKILGLEITAGKQKAAEPQKIKGASKEEIGDTGIEITHGVITEDYNTTLQGTEGIEKYDEMRKSDATVKASILVTSLPIRRANWFIQPASEDDQDKEVADFINAALFEYMTITWADLLRQALLMMPYGVMVFEKVFDTKEVNGKMRIVWRKLAPRMPKSIHNWQTEDGNNGIQQMTSGGELVSIPMDKLCVFVNEKEGDNWWGNSILRASYKHWYYKNNFYKIEAIGFERQAIGVPKAKMPEGYTPKDEAQAEKILKNLRAHEQAYIIEPSDYEIEFMDMKGNTIRDPKSSISHHNREIVKAVLAQFLELGAGTVGSRALSQDQSELFLQSLEAVANQIIDVFNKYAIPQLVDLNFDNLKNGYPLLSYAGISRADVEGLSTAYQRLTQSGAIKPGENDEQYFREMLGLPEREEDEEIDDKKDKKKVDKKNKDDITDDIGLSETLNKFKKKRVIDIGDKATIRASIENKISNLKMTEQINFISQTIEKIKTIDSDTNFFNEVNAILSEKYKEIKRLIFQQQNDFKSWRALTFAEKKVNFNGLNNMLDKSEAAFSKETTEILTEAKNKYTSQLSDAVRKKDIAKIKELSIKLKSEYRMTLKNYMKSAYEYGKNNAAREMGVGAPANATDDMKQLDLMADAIATKHVDDLVFEAKKELINQLEKGRPPAQVTGAVDVAIAKKIDQLVRTTKGTVLAGQLNIGRRQAFKKHAAKIYALQRSEILDMRTCNFCLSMDGRIVKMDDPIARQGIFHTNCRGIWVEILQDEEDKPTIAGVPKSLQAKLGDALNEIKQPKKPIVKKSSLANRFIKKEK